MEHRKCLWCGNIFLSTGPGNRRCKRCDEKYEEYDTAVAILRGKIQLNNCIDINEIEILRYLFRDG